MKDVQEVDRAVQVARRFVDDQGKALSLNSVPTPKEKSVLSHLLDQENGPFAAILQSGNFEWDGIREANKFWESVPGGKLEAERRMRSSR